jgi:hypothetical protein
MNKIKITDFKFLFSIAHKIFAAFGLVFFLVLGIFNTWSNQNQVISSLDPQNIGNDMVSVWDRRMRKMIPDLPDHGIVGYLADWDIPEYPFGEKDQTVEYLLSQYSLAPLTLQRGSDYPVIIGNFSASKDTDKIPNVLKLFDLKIIKEHTNEILILAGKVK